MGQFILANRLANRGDEGRQRSQEALRTFFSKHLSKSVTVLHEPEPPAEVARQVVIFKADAAEVAARQKDLPQTVILEEVRPRYPVGDRRVALTRAFDAAFAEAPAHPGTGAKLTVTVRGDGAGLRGAEVILFLRSGPGDVLRIPRPDEPPVLTTAAGRAAFEFARRWTPVALVAVPHGGFWPVVHRTFSGDSVAVDVPPLPAAAAGGAGWWHAALRAGKPDADAGKGIRVGVVDTGCGPHPALAHVTRVGAFLNGGATLAAAAGHDAQSHGSHVCGTLGGRPDAAGQFAGIAPGVDLFSARVFEELGGANQGDIANAVDHLARANGVHLINLSLGGDSSAIEQDAIRRAEELGTLCVCAAGNDAGKVSYPAAYPECVAVSAVGESGWGPPGSLAAAVLPDQPEKYGRENLYLAEFSNFGKQINTAGPGVGVIAAVPERFGLTAPFAMMNGTSMASPAVCGRLAAILAAAKKYTDAAPDAARVELAKSILDRNCRDIGLDGKYQGRGMLGKD